MSAIHGQAPVIEKLFVNLKFIYRISKSCHLLPFGAGVPPTIRLLRATFDCPHPSSGVSKRPLMSVRTDAFVIESPTRRLEKFGNEIVFEVEIYFFTDH